MIRGSETVSAARNEGAIITAAQQHSSFDYWEIIQAKLPSLIYSAFCNILLQELHIN